MRLGIVNKSNIHVAGEENVRNLIGGGPCKDALSLIHSGSDGFFS